MDLTKRKCVPCEGGIPPLTKKKVAEYMKQIPEGWELIIRDKIPRIKKRFKFKNFKEAMQFVGKVAKLAEKQGHHPNIFIYYNKVDLEFYTHAIHGLHDNDFIMAAKVDSKPNTLKLSFL